MTGSNNSSNSSSSSSTIRKTGIPLSRAGVGGIAGHLIRPPFCRGYGSMDLMPRTYEGHYAKFDVPFYFQQVVVQTRSLRKTLETNKKYWLPFVQISLALDKYHEIIFSNDTGENIEQRVSTLNSSIRNQLDVINGLKRGTKHKGSFVRYIAEIKSNLTQLASMMDRAMKSAAAETRLNRTDLTESQRASTELRRQSYLPPEENDLHHLKMTPAVIKKFCKQIGSSFPAESRWTLISTAAYDSPKLFTSSIALFGGAVFTAIQTIISVFAIEKKLNEYNKLQIGALTVFPVLCVGISAVLMFYSIVEAKISRHQLMKSYKKEVKELRGDLEAGLFGGPTQSQRGNSSSSTYSGLTFKSRF